MDRSYRFAVSSPGPLLTRRVAFGGKDCGKKPWPVPLQPGGVKKNWSARDRHGASAVEITTMTAPERRHDLAERRRARAPILDRHQKASPRPANRPPMRSPRRRLVRCPRRFLTSVAHGRREAPFHGRFLHRLPRCTTGKSAGFAPLRMRPVYTPMWRYASTRLAP